MHGECGPEDSCLTASWQMHWLLKPLSSLGLDLARLDGTPRNSLYSKANSRSWDNPPVSSPSSTLALNIQGSPEPFRISCSNSQTQISPQERGCRSLTESLTSATKGLGPWSEAPVQTLGYGYSLSWEKRE